MIPDRDARTPQWGRSIEELHAWNIAAGRCPNCGGTGVIYDICAINRTGNPYAEKTCVICRGTGTPKPGTAKP